MLCCNIESPSPPLQPSLLYHSQPSSHILSLVWLPSGAPLAAGWTFADAEKGILLPVTREPGLNDVGMVAWLAKLSTPECPEGREVVLICNDITHQAGSFGTKEDILFFKASEYARQRGLPRFFLAANSGARIGMTQSLKSLFQVSWTDEKDPSKGFKYIYLTKQDYDILLVKYKGDTSKLPVFCSPIKGPNGEERYIITDIIGEVRASTFYFFSVY